MNNLPIVSSNGFDQYLQEIKQIPLLSFEQEQSLAKSFRDENNLQAAQQLVLSHLRFVVPIARSYQGYGLPLADLIQEGNIGLMKAVKRFNPDLKIRLSAFAIHWVRAEIHEFILRNWRLVKVATTKAQRKLFFKLRSYKKHLGWLNREETLAIAEELGVNPATVTEMEKRLSGEDLAFDTSTEPEEEQHFNPAAYLAAPNSDPAEIYERESNAKWQQKQLHQALHNLDARSQDIITRRWLLAEENQATLQELAKEYGISAERVRQIEANGMKKIRQALEKV